MRHGSLFSGIGGFDLAAQWMGWENVFHCEWNEFGQRVLNYYWPNATSYHDITQTDFSIHRGTIDILTGGFPCQPYSVAGKRKGKEDERHLWPEMLRAIREIQPRYVVGENVRGLINWNGGMVFDEVQADLEAEGYEVLPFLLPACAVGGDHKRDRIWFIAHLHEISGQCVDFIGRKNTQQRETKIGCENRQFIHMVSTRNLVKEWEKTGDRTLCESPLVSSTHGFSEELDGITFSQWAEQSNEAYGNAIVPQVVYQIFKAIQQLDQTP